MVKYLLILITLFACIAKAQKMPAVNVNHIYVVIDSTDMSALRNSEFFTKQFAAVETHTTKANGNDQWTGTYLYGIDNYLEILDNVSGAPVGAVGMGLSVDGTGEIRRLNAILSQKFATDTLLRVKQLNDGRKLPWFNAVQIKNAHFDSVSNISFWVMEYKPEYFDYYHWKHDGKQLTRAAYLDRYSVLRKTRLLQRLKGVTFKLTDEERAVFAPFLAACGYVKTGQDTYHSPEDFIIRLVSRQQSDRSALASLDFETSAPKTGTIKVSPHISIQFNGDKGTMTFE